MNKRNFFKGLLALLALPASIYAKVFKPGVEVISRRVKLKKTQVLHFAQIKKGMFFTTARWWGIPGELYEVTGLLEDKVASAFVAPCGPTDPEWPEGTSRIICFCHTNLSQFTFYERA